MDQNSSEHGEHHEVHLPDPSVWPLIVGLAAMVFGLAIVYWTRDRSSSFAGPALGASLLFILVAAAGWAYEDGRMKRKAEEPGAHGKREARYTQVVTFAIAEGRVEAARDSGILQAVDASDNALRDLPGFQDMRIIVSPAAVGPSQAIVETTWANREGLATYEETRQTMLDMVAAHPDDVVPGSVQVFDMDVVRDTKDVGFRFGMGAAVAVLGALAIGGLMVGAGLTLFQSESTAQAGPGGGTTPPAADPYTVTATDNKFSVSTLEAPPNTQVTYTFTNNGAAPHNLHFLTGPTGTTLVPGAGTDSPTPVRKGESEKLTFTTPAAGTYYFHCDFHPEQMNGTFTVKAGAPAPGAAAGGGAAPAAGGLTVDATDNKFDKTTLDAAAGAPLTVVFNNKGKVKHNLHFYDKKGGKTLADGAGSDTAFIDGGKNETLTFTPPGAGSFYYQCDLHPTEMFGTLNVK